MTSRLTVRERRASVHSKGSCHPRTSQAIRAPLADHLLTPQNSAFLLIDWQPTQVSTVRSMDQDLLLRNAVSTVRTVKAYGVPVVHSTVNVASGQQQPTVPELAELVQ